MRSFARDVGINVVANLIAAGILYLIGAGIGLFPRNPAALLATTTISIPVMSVFLLILYLIVERRDQRRSRVAKQQNPSQANPISENMSVAMKKSPLVAGSESPLVAS